MAPVKEPFLWPNNSDPITAPGDWHLRLEWLPCGKPEVVYDIDYKEGTANIILTRFLESAWKKLMAAYHEEKAKVSVQVKSARWNYHLTNPSLKLWLRGYQGSVRITRQHPLMASSSG